jgi:hypothetical protein
MKTAINTRISTKKKHTEMKKKSLLEKAEGEGWGYELFI